MDRQIESPVASVQKWPDLLRVLGIPALFLLAGWSPLVVVAVVLGVSLVLCRRLQTMQVVWAFPWISLITVWIVSWGVRAWHPDLWRVERGVGDNLRYFVDYAPTVTAGMHEMLRVVLLCVGSCLAWVVFPVRDGLPDRSVRYARALFWGTAILTIVLLAGVVLALADIISTAPFWKSLGRVSSFATDPNALGISAFLIMVLLAESAAVASIPRWIHGLSQASAVAIIILSGSRAGLLGAIVYLLTKLLMSRQLGNYRKVFLIFGAVVIGGTCLFLSKQGVVLPGALGRAANLCVFGGVNDGCSSRLIFSWIGLQLFTGSPLVGIGPATFESMVTHAVYAHNISHGLGSWSDSGNNFYSQFLAEFGILGVVAFLLSISRLGPLADLSSRVGVYVMAGLLMVGSHLEFAQVVLLFALLLGISFAPRRLGIEPRVVPLGVLSIPVIWIISGVQSFGLYPWEELPSKELTRWTSPYAQFTVLPSISSVPTGAGVRLVNQSPATIRALLSWQKGEVVLAPGAQLGVPVGRVTVRVLNPWQPAALLGGNDTRLLGLRVQGDPAVVQ